MPKEPLSFSKDHINMKAPNITAQKLYEDGKLSVWKADLRFFRPNHGTYFTPAIAHSIEHMVSTALYSLYEGSKSVKILDFSVMACQTGCYCTYMLFDDVTVDWITAINCAIEMEYVPGATPEQCGQYDLQDYEGAVETLKNFVSSLTRELMK